MINNKSECKLLCDYGFSPFFKLLACSTSVDRQPFSLTIMHTGNLVRTDRMLSPSLSLPCKDAAVKAITYPACCAPRQGAQTGKFQQSSNGLNRSFRAGGWIQGTGPKYPSVCRWFSLIRAQTNFQLVWLAWTPCLSPPPPTPFYPWEANTAQVRHLFQKPQASFLAMQSQTRPASLLSPWGIFTYIFSSNLQCLAREWNAT